jgi:hypothetical protein
MATTDYPASPTIECRPTEPDRLKLLKRRAIENGQHSLDLIAKRGRRLSPRDDVDRAMKEDARTMRELSWSDRNDVWMALLNYELRQLHRNRWDGAPARDQLSVTT